MTENKEYKQLTAFFYITVFLGFASVFFFKGGPLIYLMGFLGGAAIALRNKNKKGVGAK